MRLVVIPAGGFPADTGLALPSEAVEGCTQTVAMYGRTGFALPWVGYLAIQAELCVGCCAFKEQPHGGRVEIGYTTFPAFEKRGIATRMAMEMVTIARTACPGIVVTANTLPETSASTTILRKLGFEACGAVFHPEDGLVWQWELPAR